MSRYWLIWFAVSFTAFIVPETIALTTGRPQDTLSAAIWRILAHGAARARPRRVAVERRAPAVHLGWGLWR